MLPAMHVLFELVVMLFELCWFSLLSLVDFLRQFVYPKAKCVKGQRVLVTGAGSGFGRLLAVRFARLGCTVIGWDVSEPGLRETQRLIEGERGRDVFDYLICDVSDRDDCYETASRVLSEFGDVDILINNAGVVNGTRLLETPDDKIQRTFDVNLLSHFWITKAFLPSMLSHGRGHIVNVASCAGMLGVNKLTDYCASKAGDLIFSEAVALELAAIREETGVRIPVTAVAPYHMTTGMFSGCYTRYQLLLTDMDPNYAADRALAGILAEDRLVYIPRCVFLLNVLKQALPAAVGDRLVKFMGANNFMDNYKGSTSKSKTC